MNKQHSSSRGYVPWLVGLLAGLLYLLTLAPGVFWQDSAMFQTRVWHTDLTGQLGLALSHPLYIVLCRAFTQIPLGDFAWRVNLFSALPQTVIDVISRIRCPWECSRATLVEVVAMGRCAPLEKRAACENRHSGHLHR